MRDSSTTSTIMRNSGISAGRFNTLCSLALMEVLDNAYPVVDGQPRRFTRRDTEALTVAIDLHSAGIMPKRIRPILSKEAVGVISRELRFGANYLVVYPDASVSTFHSIENSTADKRSGCFPTVTLDLADIRNRVERAILDAERAAS